MERKPVQSSNIVSVGYDDTTKTMEVEFLNGSLYRYHDVPAEKHAQMTAPGVSVGQFLHKEIKPAYRCERVLG